LSSKRHSEATCGSTTKILNHIAFKIFYISVFCGINNEVTDWNIGPPPSGQW
jgi:hypothetical protein